MGRSPIGEVWSGLLVATRGSDEEIASFATGLRRDPMANPRKRRRTRAEEERRRRLIELATLALIVAHDALRLLTDVLNR